MSAETWLDENLTSTDDLNSTAVADEAPVGDVTGDDETYALGDDAVDTSVTDDVEDPEIEAIKARVKEMEEEAAKLKEMQKEAEDTLMSPSHSSHALSSPVSAAEKGDVDSRSVYVGNVDYAATATELEQHFHGCGSVNRVTILCDKFTGHPKGFAYVEFADKDSVDTATQLSDSLFKGRQIKVNPKRTNVPGISSTNRGRGRGRGRGAFRGFGGYYSPRSRGRGAYRSRRAQWFSPY